MHRNTIFVFVLAFATLVPAFAQDESAEADPEELGYSVGVQVGRFLEMGADSVDVDALINGLRDVLSGAEVDVSDEKVLSDWNRFQQIAEQVRSEVLAKEGQAFLAQKEQEEDVQKTDSGLLYTVVEAGSGARPSADSTVTVHYRGTFIDGNEFDSSYARDEPVTFPLKGVIPGWQEGLQLMKEGAKYKLYIPYELAYGAQGRPPQIPAYSTLVFEVELLGVDTQ